MENSVNRFEDETGDDKAYRFQHDPSSKVPRARICCRMSGDTQFPDNEHHNGPRAAQRSISVIERTEKLLVQTC